MPEKKGKAVKSSAPKGKKKTSLHLDPDVYDRALVYKVTAKMDVGDIVTEALDEYLKRHGA